jgi:hypothetical protein
MRPNFACVIAWQFWNAPCGEAPLLRRLQARRYGQWKTAEGRHILIAVARYLAAHSPTERAALQTADIARHLMRGGELHQKEGASS